MLLDRGYGATSIEEVCRAAGVTKGGLFYHFDSKEQLASAAVERFFAGLVEAGEASRPEQSATPLAALEAYLDSLRTLVEGPQLSRGCLLGAMAIQTTESHPAVWAATSAALGEWRAVLISLIEAAAAERSVDVEPAELADGLLAAVEGGLLLDRAGVSSGAAVAAVDHFHRYLSLLLSEGGAP